MHTRRARTGDEDIVRDLRIRALTDAPSAFGSTLERELARTPAEWSAWCDPGVVFLLEPDDGSPVGLVAGGSFDDEPDVVHVLSLWVDPAHRGHGGADLLMGEVLTWAATTGRPTVALHVTRGNDAAMRLYRRHGFELAHDHFVRERDGAVELAMQRAVTP